MDGFSNYILGEDGKTPIKVGVLAWAQWFDNSKNRFLFSSSIGDVEISTVFIGIPMIWGVKNGAFVFCLFETMIDPCDPSGATTTWERYNTWEAAKAGHEAAVKEYSKVQTPPRKIDIDKYL